MYKTGSITADQFSYWPTEVSSRIKRGSILFTVGCLSMLPQPTHSQQTMALSIQDLISLNTSYFHLINFCSSRDLNRNINSPFRWYEQKLLIQTVLLKQAGKALFGLQAFCDSSVCLTICLFVMQSLPNALTIFHEIFKMEKIEAERLYLKMLAVYFKKANVDCLRKSGITVWTV